MLDAFVTLALGQFVCKHARSTQAPCDSLLCTILLQRERGMQLSCLLQLKTIGLVCALSNFAQCYLALPLTWGVSFDQCLKAAAQLSLDLT